MLFHHDYKHVIRIIFALASTPYLKVLLVCYVGPKKALSVTREHLGV